MKLDRKKIKTRIDVACLNAFAQRNTVNRILAVGLEELVDAICDELEAVPEKKKVAT